MKLTLPRDIYELFVALIIAALVAMAAGCASPSPRFAAASTAAATVADAAGATAPGQIADRTVRDEQALLALELAYKLARTAGELGLDAGLIKGQRARDLAAIDNRAYLAVTLARSLYTAGNEASWRAALAQANRAVADILPLLSKGPGQ